MSPRRAARVLVALVLLVGLTGCISLPRSGPIRTAVSRGDVDRDPSFDLTPGGPRKGASPANIVDGFLAAMEATPLNTFVAREFLSSDSANAWVPERGTIVYDGHELRSRGSTVTATFSDIDELDARGRWLGDPSHGAGISERFHLVLDKGEWRISHPPDAMLVSQAHFESEFSQFSLYFFDPSAQVLVPEPVYLPRGAQASTRLVSGLLLGPESPLSRVERTFIPSETALGDISVPVSRDGVADVALSDDVLDLNDDQLNLMFAQLAWTLKQVPGIDRMRVTVDGNPLDLPGEPVDVDVEGWTEFDPGVPWASQALFGLRSGRVISFLDNSERRVTGAFGAAGVGLRSIGVDLSAQTVAGVTSNGRSVVVAPRDKVTTTSVLMHTAYSRGTDLLRPSYDLYGNLWDIDDTAAGARVLTGRRTLQTLTVPGVTGHRVLSYALSRDGSRLVAAVAGTGGDRLVLVRIEHTATGHPIGAVTATPISLGGPGLTVEDVAWRTPTSLAVLATGTGGSQLIVVKIDGSSVLGSFGVGGDRLPFGARALVASPLASTTLYVETSAGQLLSLSASGRWTGTAVRNGLRAVTYVG
jgi:hypothetical protein